MPNPSGGYKQDPWITPHHNPGTVYVNGESHSGTFVGGIFHASGPTTLEGNLKAKIQSKINIIRFCLKRLAIFLIME